MSKNKVISPKDFYANDLFNKWKVMMKKAEYSIKVFTPYLDNTLIELIDDVEDNIEITIITSLEGDNLFQRGYELNALKESMIKGAKVKNLLGLHAKVLMVDNTYVSLGSQNFTNRGRKNKEAGFISSVSFAGSEFLSRLAEWDNESKKVSIELLENLIDFLCKNNEEITALKDEFEKGIDSIISDFNEKELENLINYSSHYNTIYRFSQGEVVLTKTLPPPRYDYYSFFSGENNNLCKWIKTNSKGEEEHIELKDYDYCPALNVKTMQMAFLRIHTSRITFMKTNFKIDQWQDYKIGDVAFEIEFSFLKSNTKGSNIKITIINEDKGKGHLYYLFNGIEFKLVKTKFSSDYFENFVHVSLISIKEKQKEFLNYLIEPTKFATPLSQPKEIEKFLPKYRYKVGIIEYGDCPILIFNEY